jgi:hypothetical protein
MSVYSNVKLHNFGKLVKVEMEEMPFEEVISTQLWKEFQVAHHITPEEIVVIKNAYEGNPMKEDDPFEGFFTDLKTQLQ